MTQNYDKSKYSHITKFKINNIIIIIDLLTLSSPYFSRRIQEVILMYKL